VLDGNHPLSGIALRLSLKVTHVRMATEQEQEAGTCGTGFFKIEIGDAPDSNGSLLQ
jgi:FKBP-type peptidyl-prolyl cis-trans isomerase SlyD